MLSKHLIIVQYLDRSLCCLTCKWTYQADDQGHRGWNDEFWEMIGLDDFVKEKYQRCGKFCCLISIICM